MYKKASKFNFANFLVKNSFPHLLIPSALCTLHSMCTYAYCSYLCNNLHFSVELCTCSQQLESSGGSSQEMACNINNIYQRQHPLTYIGFKICLLSPIIKNCCTSMDD